MSVLILDDDVSFARSLGDFLTEEGFDVGTATTVSEAEEMLASLDDNLRLVIVDQRLGGESGAPTGLDFIERLQSRKVDFVLLSAFVPSEGEMERVRRLGIPILLKADLSASELKRIVASAEHGKGTGLSPGMVRSEMADQTVIEGEVISSAQVDLVSPEGLAEALEDVEARFEKRLEAAFDRLNEEKLDRKRERSRSLRYYENLSNMTQRYRLLGFALVVGLGALFLLMLVVGLTIGWSFAVLVPGALSAGLLGIAIQVFRQVNKYEDLLLEATKTWDDSDRSPEK